MTSSIFWGLTLEFLYSTEQMPNRGS